MQASHYIIIGILVVIWGIRIPKKLKFIIRDQPIDWLLSMSNYTDIERSCNDIHFDGFGKYLVKLNIGTTHQFNFSVFHKLRLFLSGVIYRSQIKIGKEHAQPTAWLKHLLLILDLIMEQISDPSSRLCKMNKQLTSMKLMP